MCSGCGVFLFRCCNANKSFPTLFSWVIWVSLGHTNGTNNVAMCGQHLPYAVLLAFSCDPCEIYRQTNIGGTFKLHFVTARVP